MKVLVTGANGHVGNNLCWALLGRNYEVRASVRSAAETLHAAAWNGSTQLWREVELVELDVRDAPRFSEALAGVDVLFHVAAVYALYTGSRAADDEMVRVSVEGVENALRGAARRGVRKVVLTSSMVTLPCRAPGEPPATEEDWRTDLRVPYYRAKTLGEQRAWSLARELGVSLVSLLPGVIGGPGFLRRTPSTDLCEGIMLGSMRFGAPRVNLPWIDVRDVISGHVLAAEKDVDGRFLLVNETFPDFLELSQLMHAIDPDIAAAKRYIPEALNGLLPTFDALGARLFGLPRTLTGELVRSHEGMIWNLSAARAQRELGWRPEVTLERSLSDTIASLRALRASEAAQRARGALAHRHA